MKPFEDQFDDFKIVESSIAINETIGRIFDKELSEVEQFKEDMDDQLSLADDPKEQLTEMIIGYIQGVGDVNQVNLCSYSARNGAIDAWGFNGDDDLVTIDLFLTIYVDPCENKKIYTNDLDRNFAKLQRFYEHSLSGVILSKIENDKSDLFHVADLIYNTSNINKIRLFILTNAIIPSGYSKANDELENGTTCEYIIWDAKRVMQQDNIISGRNPIIVDFEADYNCTLPCIMMPDVSENVTCYLCIISGIVLSQVYHKYQHQILEMNVRTFLQFKGANKGIRDTMIGHKATKKEKDKGILDSAPEPDMFFAYNNGISATAAEVKLNENGTAITQIKSWQIVNGGQTTASIEAVMNMKDVDINTLTKVYVPMKISVIKDKDKLPLIVPKISRFANTQSAIKKSDFNINEEFLTELEQRSREEWVLDSTGKPVSKWFFERTRGQYLDKARRQSARGKKEEREYYAEYPQNQMFDKTLLSKFMVAWDQNPACVCRGGEKNYETFFERTKQAGIRFDQLRYRRTIAKAILFKAIDALYGKDGISLPGYKSNMVAYTMAMLSLTSNKSLNLDLIWSEQCVLSPSVYNEMTIDLYSIYAKLICGAEHISYKIKESYTTAEGKRRNRYVPKNIPEPELNRLRDTLLYKVLLYVKNIQPFVYNHIIEINEGENINEWSKKTVCWDALKTNLSKQGTKYNIPEELCSTTGDLDVEITEAQQKYITKAVDIGADTWLSINKWSKDNPGLLTPKEQAFIGQVGFYMKRKRPLSYKQSKWALSILEKAKDKGWNE